MAGNQLSSYFLECTCVFLSPVAARRHVHSTDSSILMAHNVGLLSHASYGVLWLVVDQGHYSQSCSCKCHKRLLSLSHPVAGRKCQTKIRNQHSRELKAGLNLLL